MMMREGMRMNIKSKWLKFIFVICVFFGGNSIVQAQCGLTINPSDTVINCDDSITVQLSAYADFALNNDFNDSTAGAGWLATSSAQFDNPYIPNPLGPQPNDAYLWMGPMADVPRALTSSPLDLAFGGIICFDLVYAVQGNGAPIEGPDESDEGVSLQYSVDGGTTWIDIIYFQPDGQMLPMNPGNGGPGANGQTPFTQWGNYCFPIPPGAQTNMTQIQWIQSQSSTANFDHWGLDNIQISVNDPSYGFFTTNDSSNIDTNVVVYYPTADSTFTIIYTNNIDDTCSQTFNAYVNPTDAGPDIIAACDGIGEEIIVTGVSPWSPVTWAPPNGLTTTTNDTTFANPLDDQLYSVVTNCGTDSILVDVVPTFTPNIALPDTVCLYGQSQIELTTTPASVTIASVTWEDASTLSAPTGSIVQASPYVTTQYIATAVSDSGCTRFDTTMVFVDGILTPVEITPMDTQICVGASANLSADYILPPPTAFYDVQSIAYTPTTNPGGGTIITGLADEEITGPIPLGFTFDFYGNSFTDLFLSTNGWVRFGFSTDPDPTPDPLPSMNGNENIIAFAWSDLSFPGGGTAEYYTIGTSPNSAFVIEYTDVTHDGNVLVSVTVQLVLYESGIIQINNIDIQSDGGNMTQGLENINASQAAIVPGHNNTPFTAMNESWIFIPYAPPENPTYIWSPSTYLNSTSDSLVTSTPLTDITYDVTVTNGYCTTTAQTTVYLDTTIITFPPDETTCSALDSFQLDVITNASATTNCSYTLNVFDGANAAWFGAEAVNIFLDGTLFNSYSNTGGAMTSYTFSVPANQLMEVSYTQSLSSGDNSYELFSPEGDSIFADGPGPVSGSIVYSELTCNGGFIYDWEALNGGYISDTSLSNPIVNTAMGEGFYVEVESRVGCVFSDTVFVILTSGFDLTVSNDTIICDGDSIQLSATLGGDSYTWTPNYNIIGANTANPTVFPSVDTTYTVFVDSMGCVSSDNVFVEVGNLAIDSVGTSDISCAAPGEIRVYGSSGYPPYTYSIDNITYLTTDTFSITAAGTYDVSVQDSLGCIVTMPTPVGQLDTFIIDNFMSTNNTCFGDSAGTITINGLGGTPPYEYSIDNGTTYQMANSFTGLGAGSYTLILRDALLCNSNFETVIITDPMLLTLILDTAIGANCGVADGSIQLSSTGGTGTPMFSLNGGANQSSGTFSNLAGNTYEMLVSDANMCTDTLDVLVPQSSDVAIAIDSINDVSCNGAGDGAIVVQVSAGTPPYSLTLNSVVIGAGTDTIYPNLNGGTYTIEVTDSLGCSASVMPVVAEPTAVVLGSTPTNVNCFGDTTGSLLLAASGGAMNYQYSLTSDVDFQSSGLFTPLAAGSYTAYTADDNNCRDTITVQITEPALPLTIDHIGINDIACAGDNDGNIVVSMVGGTAPYQYSTDNISFQNSNTLGGLAGGNYTAYIMDSNGCTIDSSGNIIDEPSPLLLSVLSTVDVTCNNGSNGVINVSTSGGSTPYSFTITGGTAQPDSSFTNLTPGAYTVTVTDSANCTNTVSVNLVNPAPIVPTIVTVPIACSGDNNGEINITNVSGGTAPFQVIFNSNPAVPLATNDMFTGLADGNYTIEITDANNCTSGILNASLSNPNALQIDTVIIDNVSCQGASDGIVTIDATGGSGILTYYLSTGVNDTTINGTGVFEDLIASSAAGYPLWVQDENGCTESDVAVVTEPSLASIDSTQISELTCFGYDDAQVEVFASGGAGAGNYNFTLADGTPAINGSLFTGLSSGAYDIYLTDVNGCQDSTEIIIVNPAPVMASITADTTVIEMGDTLHLVASLQNANGDLTYAWTPTQGLTCTDCSNPIALIYADEEFTVTVTDSLGCNDDASIDIDVSDELYFFIPNAFTPGNTDNMNDMFEVMGQDIKYVEMLVYNRWGEKIFESSNPYVAWDGSFKGVLQQPGVYTYYTKITFLNDRAIEKKGSVTLIR